MLNDFQLDKIYCTDCIKGMRKLPENCIDLVVTSPPYDNLRDYKGYNFDFENIAKGLHRVIKEGGIIVWVVGDSTVDGSETGTSFKQALYFKDIGFTLHDTMIYEKNGPSFPTSNRYYQVFEYMFIFSKGKPKTVNLIKDRRSLWKECFGEKTNRQKDGTIQSVGHQKYQPFGTRFNVWKYNTGFGYSTKDEIAYEHPAIFPEKLAEDQIKSWSNEKDIVFDPMCGSGTTCKMAKLLNRNYLGFDISEEYCKLAEERLNQKTKALIYDYL